MPQTDLTTEAGVLAWLRRGRCLRPDICPLVACQQESTADAEDAARIAKAMRLLEAWERGVPISDDITGDFVLSLRAALHDPK